MICEAPRHNGIGSVRMFEPAVRPADPKLRRAAIHEGAHAIACIALTGQPAQARVYRTADGTWGGQVRPGAPYANVRVRRLIGLAGICGVCIDHGLTADTAFDMMLSGELRLPPADVPLAGTFYRQDIHDVYALLLPRWTQVEAVADRLADTAR